MHKTGNVVVEGVAIGKIQFLNADYEEQIKRYMTGTEEEEKKFIEIEKCLQMKLRMWQKMI